MFGEAFLFVENTEDKARHFLTLSVDILVLQWPLVRTLLIVPIFLIIWILGL